MYDEREGIDWVVRVSTKARPSFAGSVISIEKDSGVGISVMGLAENRPANNGKFYSWRKTLAFFVVAALVGWAGVFGAIYATLTVLDLVRGPDIAQEVEDLQKIAPAAGPGSQVRQ